MEIGSIVKILEDNQLALIISKRPGWQHYVYNLLLEDGDIISRYHDEIEEIKSVIREKELYGWHIKEQQEIIRKEFIPNIIKEAYGDLNNFTISEGISMTLDEIYDEEDIIPEFVKQYQERRPDEYLCSVGSIDKDNGIFYIAIVSTFELLEDGKHKNRILYITLLDEDGEDIFTLSFVK